ncbi:TPA: hypothetical protein R1730_001506, partial [Campylobacter lari]|nr:hypothetical protein [Campylobacter lari]
HCEVKTIDEEIVLNPQAKIHILSFKLSDDRKLKIINQFLKNNKYTGCYYDVFYTNEVNVYEVLKIEF